MPSYLERVNVVKSCIPYASTREVYCNGFCTECLAQRSPTITILQDFTISLLYYKSNKIANNNGVFYTDT